MLSTRTEQLITPVQASKSGKINRKRLFLRLIGTALLVFFLWRLNLNLGQVAEGLLKANLWLVAISILLIFPIILLKTWRWCLLLKNLNIPLSFGRAYHLYALGLSAGSFTPGQLGDAIKAWHLRDMGHSLGQSLLSVVLDRLFDIIVLLVLTGGSILILGPAFIGEWPTLLLLLVGTGMGLVILGFASLRQRLLSLLKHILGNKIKEGSEKLVFPLSKTSASDLLACLSITILTMFTAIMRTWLLAFAIGMNLSPLEVIAASSLATFAGLIPISVSGIGARDLTLIGILAQMGFARESALVLSTLLLVLNLVNLLVGMAIWFSRPRRFR
ncbi:MAG: flippase-like domain-containing protein [Chloroflexi bacterium]|uniref:Flippase-like domain-containing protein n=1 Tax=Candidatus Chlorohelix allophototropha TaxID=3003348 RepID=A0A8T7M578_9CHLR|nr:flippase-like domain-containing protein [Chloroflexota bacterium]WJW69179.1 flippase-like domain-containing protein [Chloroflexota bacterium L227-S17]